MAIETGREQFAVVLISPTMVGTQEARGRARVGTTELRSPMPTAIQQHMDLIAAAANQNHRGAGETARDEVAFLRDFGHVAEKTPASGENSLRLEFLDFVADKDCAADK